MPTMSVNDDKGGGAEVAVEALADAVDEMVAEQAGGEGGAVPAAAAAAAAAAGADATGAAAGATTDAAKENAADAEEEGGAEEKEGAAAAAVADATGATTATANKDAADTKEGATATAEEEEEEEEDPQTIDDYKALLAKRDRQIVVLKETIAEKDRQITFLGGHVGARESTIVTLQNQLVAANAAVAAAKASAAVAKKRAPSASGRKKADASETSSKKKSKSTKASGKRKRGRPSKSDQKGAKGTSAAKASKSADADAPKSKKPRKETDKMKERAAILQEKWEAKVKELLEYKAAYGDCNVPLKYKANPTLGSWVNKQRENYRNHLRGRSLPPGSTRISPERIARLNEIGFDWNAKEDGTPAYDRESLVGQNWDARVKDLIAYKEEHGNCLVPTHWKENPKLAHFVARARRAYRLQQMQQKGEEQDGGKPDKVTSGGRKKSPSSSSPLNKQNVHLSQWLTPERIAQLDEIGFVWAIRNGSHEELWEEKYQRLKAYKQQFGDCRVSKKHDKVLNAWAMNQRSAYKYTMNEETANDPNKPTLSAERITKLQRLGFEWDLEEKKRVAAWEARFRDLITFKSEHGHCRVPKQYKANMKLSNWVYDQRKNYKSMQTGKGNGRKGLTDERILRLEELGFEWTVLPSKQQADVHDEEEEEEQEPEVDPYVAAQQHQQHHHQQHLHHAGVRYY